MDGIITDTTDIALKDKIVTLEGLSALHAHNNGAYVSKTEVIPVRRGGTGAIDASTARENLGITPENIGAKPAFDVLPMEQGGTNAEDGATGLKNLLAAGITVLSHNQYGSVLPEAGTVGRIFFKLADGHATTTEPIE